MITYSRSSSLTKQAARSAPLPAPPTTTTSRSPLFAGYAEQAPTIGEHPGPACSDFLYWVKALLHSVDDQPDAEAVHARLDRVLDALADKVPSVAEHLDRPAPTSSPPFPKAIWRQIWSNNPGTLEREISRRTDVCGIFPDRQSLIRLVGAVLAEQRDEWTEMRRYIGLEVLAKSCLRLVEHTDTDKPSQEVTLPAITA